MKGLVLALAVLAMPAKAQIALGMAQDSRVQTMPYEANRVYRLGVAQRYQLTVLFNPDEQVENVALGDGDAWDVTLNGRGDALFIKPLRMNGPTNMTVITNRRLYSFELTPIGGVAPDTPFAIRFIDSSAPESAPATTLARYRLGGALGLRPVAVSDDGQRTTIEWRATQTLPAIFAINREGQEILADGQMRDGRFVIEGVYRTLVFRLDGQTARADRQAPRVRR